MEKLIGKEITFNVIDSGAEEKAGNVTYWVVTADCGGTEFKAVAFAKLDNGREYTMKLEKSKGDKPAAPYKVLAIEAKKETTQQQAAREQATAAANVDSGNDDFAESFKRFTPEQRRIMESSGIIPANAPDFAVANFFNACSRYNLDPFAREIYLLERRAWNKDANKYISTWPVLFSIDGIRSMVQESGEYVGLVDWEFDGLPMNQWVQDAKRSFMETRAANADKLSSPNKDIKKAANALINQSAVPFAMSVTVLRMVNGRECRFTRQIFCHEYMVPTNPMYDTMPFAMCMKCLEVAVLRAAFADKVGKMYIEEEFAKEVAAITQGSVSVGQLALPEATQALENANTLADLLNLAKVTNHLGSDFGDLIEAKRREIEETKANQAE